MTKKLLTLFIASLMSGCALYDHVYDGRPQAKYFDPPPEYKLKSASHWQIVANDIASQIVEVTKAGNQAVFVSNSANAFVTCKLETCTVFGRVFASQLRSALLEQGAQLATTPTGAISLSLSVDAVEHVSIDRYVPGTLTLGALGAGVLAARENFDTRARAATTLGGLILAADATLTAKEILKRPYTEVVLTTSATKDTNFIFHRTNVYYIDSVDSSLFTGSVGRQFLIQGGVNK